MKCVLCKQTLRGEPDLKYHADVKHKLTLEQYRMAAKAVAPAVRQINAVNAALISSGLKKAGLVVLALMLLGGCRGVDRLLGNNDDDPVATAPATVSALGDWSGSGVLAGDITINGHLAIMTMDIPTQAGATASGTWQLLLDNSNQPGGPPPSLIAQGTVAGTINASGLFTYTLIESPSCPAESHGTGQISGNSMAVDWTGTGNPACALWFDGGSGTLTR